MHIFEKDGVFYIYKNTNIMSNAVTSSRERMAYAYFVFKETEDPNLWEVLKDRSGVFYGKPPTNKEWALQIANYILTD